MTYAQPKLQILLLAAGGLLFAFSTSVVNADFNATSWRLSSGVQDSDGGLGANDFLINTTVQNPFDQPLNAAYSNSVAQTAHQYNWNSATGSFNNAVHLETQGGTSFISFSDDLVRFTATTDVLLSVDAQYTYALAPGDRRAIWQISVNTVPPSALGYTVGHSAAPTFGDPPNGAFNINFTRLLPAGAEYRFRSVFELRSLSGSPTVTSIGDGYAHFTLTSVPEPTALSPLVFGAVLLRNRGPRRGQTRPV